MSDRKTSKVESVINDSNDEAQSALAAANTLLHEGLDRASEAGRAGVASVRRLGAEIGLADAEDVRLAARGAGKLAWEWVRANPLKSALAAGAAAAWLVLRGRR